jgi:hypothetical protein
MSYWERWGAGVGEHFVVYGEFAVLEFDEE